MVVIALQIVGWIAFVAGTLLDGSTTVTAGPLAGIVPAHLFFLAYLEELELRLGPPISTTSGACLFWFRSCQRPVVNGRPAGYAVYEISSRA